MFVTKYQKNQAFHLLFELLNVMAIGTAPDFSVGTAYSACVPTKIVLKISKIDNPVPFHISATEGFHIHVTCIPKLITLKVLLLRRIKIWTLNDYLLNFF